MKNFQCSIQLILSFNNCVSVCSGHSTMLRILKSSKRREETVISAFDGILLIYPNERFITAYGKLIMYISIR